MTIRPMATPHRVPLSVRVATVTYGALAYLTFVTCFAYLVGFVGGVGVPKGIDDGAAGSALLAVGVDLALVTVFALQHSVMARPWFKRGWTRVVPAGVERSTYVLVSSGVLALLLWQWRPVTDEVWSLGPAWARGVVWALFAAGWALVVVSTCLIGHADMFGLAQVLARWRQRPYVDPGFQVPGLYRLVRHPLYAGFIVAFWAAPDMSAGRLLFAAATTAYILAAIPEEERDLTDHLGEDYLRYAAQVPRLVPVRWPVGAVSGDP